MFLKYCSLLKLTICAQIRNGNIKRILNLVDVLLKFQVILNFIFHCLFIKLADIEQLQEEIAPDNYCWFISTGL